VLGSDGPKFNYDLFALQAGTDIYRKESSDGSRDHGGAYVAFGQIDGDVWHYTGVRAGRDTLQAWSLGAYWTHFGAPGWYIDAVAQGTWYDAKSRSSRSFASLKNDGFGLGASLEGGYPIALKPGWTIEPQAQLVYQRIWFDSANDGAATVKFSNVESLGGRVGARLIATWQETGEDVAADRRKMSVWLRANLWHEFMGKPRTTFSSADGPVPFHAALGGTSVEFNVGVTAQFTRAMSFFASAGYQAGFERNAQAYEGRAGVRITW
jgi:outer membrane autotransporter protein